MVEGGGTPMVTGWALHSLCVRSCKNIDHDACDIAPCREGRCDSPLIGGVKLNLPEYMVSTLFYCPQPLFIPVS